MSDKWEVDFGIVVEDKEYFSNDLKVYVQEVLPFSTAGHDNTSKQKISVQDEVKSIELNMEFDNSNVIIAKYIDLFTNRKNPPDMRQGEQVLIIRYRDTDVYYWYASGRDDNLRRLEQFRLSISDDSTIQKDLGDDNTYYIEMDTLHKKSIKISTSKSDGEEYRYFIHIDAKANTLRVWDDSENEIFLDSNVPRIRLANRSKSFIDLNDKDIIVACPQDIVIKSGRQLVLDTPSMTSNVHGTMVLKSNNIALDGANITIKSATIGLNGSVQLAGNLVSGPITAPSITNGGPGTTYTPGTVNLDNGQSTTPSPSPDTGGSLVQRNATAWQQIDPAIDKICQVLTDLGGNAGTIAEIQALSNQSILNNLKGEELE